MKTQLIEKGCMQERTVAFPAESLETLNDNKMVVWNLDPAIRQRRTAHTLLHLTENGSTATWLVPQLIRSPWCHGLGIVNACEVGVPRIGNRLSVLVILIKCTDRIGSGTCSTYRELPRIRWIYWMFMHFEILTCRRETRDKDVRICHQQQLLVIHVPIGPNRLGRN